MIYLIMRGLDARELEVSRQAAQPELKKVLEHEISTETKGGGFDVQYGDESFEMTFTKAKPGLRRDRASLEKNLRRIVGQADAHGVPVVVMNYPARRDFYEIANLVIRTAATQSDARFVDLTSRFRPSARPPPARSISSRTGIPMRRATGW